MANETEVFLAVADAMPADFSTRARLHFAKAVRKHPRFADALFSEDEKEDAEFLLERARTGVDYLAKNGWLDGAALAICEIDEAQLAYAKGENAETVSELYDAVAVLMRMIAVVEGRQKLGGEE